MKRILSFVLALSMLCGILPAQALSDALLEGEIVFDEAGVFEKDTVFQEDVSFGEFEIPEVQSEFDLVEPDFSFNEEELDEDSFNDVFEESAIEDGAELLLTQPEEDAFVTEEEAFVEDDGVFEIVEGEYDGGVEEYEENADVLLPWQESDAVIIAADLPGNDEEEVIEGEEGTEEDVKDSLEEGETLTAEIEEAASEVVESEMAARGGELVSRDAAPPKVENVKFTYDPSAPIITLMWDSQGEGITYEVWYDTDPSAIGTWDNSVGSATKYKYNTITIGETWYFKVVAVDSDGNRGSLAQATLITVPCKPEAPASLTLTNKAYDTSTNKAVVTAKWSGVADGKGYILQWSTSKSFPAGSTGEKKIADLSTVTYDKSGLKIGTTYYFRVCAYAEDSDGNVLRSAYSPIKSIVGTSGAVTLTSIKELDPSIACGYKIKWSAVTGADGYAISIQDVYTGEYKVKNKQLKGKANTSYTVTGLTAGGAYQVTVRSYRSSFSYKSTTTYSAYLVPKVYVPKSLTITHISPTSFKVSWKKIYGIKGYHVHVEAAEINGDPTLKDPDFEKLDADTTDLEYTLSGLKTGYPYTIQVSTYVTAQGKNIRTRDFTTSDLTLLKYSPTALTELIPEKYREKTVKPIPATVTGVSVALKGSGTSKRYMQINWNANESLDETTDGYLILRTMKNVYTGKKSYTIFGTGKHKLGQSSPTFVSDAIRTNSFKDTTLTESDIGSTVSYQVYSFVNPMKLADGNYAISKKSTAVSKTFEMAKPKITIAHNDAGKIIVKWTAVWGATGYKAYRSAENKVTSSAKKYNGTALQYTDSASTIGKKYYFWVQPYHKESSIVHGGPYAGSKSGKRSGPAPTNVKTTAVNARRMTVSWKKPASVVTSQIKHYIVYRKKANAASWKKIATVSNTTKKYVDTGLVYHGRYGYAVVAEYANGALSRKAYLQDSSTATTKTKLRKTSKVTVINTTTSVLEWKKVLDTTGYWVVVTNTVNGSKSVYNAGSNLKYTISGLTAGVKYTAQVYPYITYNDQTYPTKTEMKGDPSLLDTEYTNAGSDVKSVFVAPKATSSVTVSGIGKTSVWVSWKKSSVSGQQVKYIVQYKKGSGSWTDFNAEGTTELQINVTGLDSKKKYTFRVIPYYEKDGVKFKGSAKKSDQITTK